MVVLQVGLKAERAPDVLVCEIPRGVTVGRGGVGSGGVQKAGPGWIEISTGLASPMDWASLRNHISQVGPTFRLKNPY